MKWLVAVTMFLISPITVQAEVADTPAFEPDTTRVALVIGNSAYGQPGWYLPNPVNDAKLMTDALEAVGFDVHPVYNAGEDEMEAAFRDHGDGLRAAGPDAVGFVFFAGHGVQADGLNFLLPIDAEVYTEADLYSEAPRLGDLMSHLSRAGNAANFVVLDACRNNNLPRAFRSATGGLAQVPAVRGTLIAYATKPGAVAEDGAGSNSPYSSVLASVITEPGLSAESLFRTVATRVETLTDDRQQPWMESGLRGEADFCFAGCDRSNVGPIASAEQIALQFAIRLGTPTALEAFLVDYPGSTSRGLVEAELASLSEAGRTAGRDTSVSSDTSPAVDAVETADLGSAALQNEGVLQLQEAARSAWDGRMVTGEPAKAHIDEALAVFFEPNTANANTDFTDQINRFSERAIQHRLQNGPAAVRVISGCALNETSGPLCSMRGEWLQNQLINAGVARDAFAPMENFGRHRQLDPANTGVDGQQLNRYAMAQLLEK